MAGPGTEVAEAPELGIGPQVPDPAHKPTLPPAFLSPEVRDAVPPTNEPKPEGSPAPASGWTWSQADLRRGKPEDVPEEYRADFIRLQTDFKNVQSGVTRRDEDLRRREAALQQQRRELQAIQSKLASAPAQTQATKAEAGEAMGKIATMLKDPDLDPDTKSAIELMMDVFEERFQERVGDRFKKLDEEVLPAIQNMGNQEVKANSDAFIADRQIAYEKYGDDEVNTYGDQIVSALGLEVRPVDGIQMAVRVRQPWTNPATGQPHTVSSLYELLSGKTAEAAAAARAEDERLRTESKGKVLPAASVASAPSGKLSEAEALDLISSTMSIPRR